MIVRLHYADGQSEDHPLKNGEHLADYIQRVDVPADRRIGGSHAGVVPRLVQVEIVRVVDPEVVRNPRRIDQANEAFARAADEG